ncbi:MAG: response regulator [Bdellovibrionales bacterium]|nr:response regulator [Bdellovibrionales bacterium]
MANENILVVDDEADILELVRYNLAKEGYSVTCAPTGEEALAAANEHTPNVVVLDLMLPGIDGLEVCRQLKRRNETETVPIIMLSAKGEEADIVSGLELGADDYVTKPFSPRILVARVKAALRRMASGPGSDMDVVRVHELMIDPRRHVVELSGKRLDLTPTEFRVLHFLARHPGWVFTRYQIVDAVKGENYPVTDRSVDVQIVGLRKKLGFAEEYIETVRGVGYRFKE